MNTLELKNFGLQEMTRNEISDTYGGGKWLGVGLAYAGFLCACAAGGPITAAVAIGSLVYACVTAD